MYFKRKEFHCVSTSWFQGQWVIAPKYFPTLKTLNETGDSLWSCFLSLLYKHRSILMLTMLTLTNAGIFKSLMSWITCSTAKRITNTTSWEYLYTSLFKGGESSYCCLSFVLPNIVCHVVYIEVQKSLPWKHQMSYFYKDLENSLTKIEIFLWFQLSLLR